MLLPKANQQQINIALSKIKDTINNSDYGNFHFRHRPKNEETLIKLGYLHDHVLDVILTLTYRNYCTGPEPNISRSSNAKGAVWEFGKEVEGIEVYIKIQIIPMGTKNECICISFHESERKMRYPYDP